VKRTVKNLILFLPLVFILGCNGVGQNDHPEIRQEINALETNKSKKDYLINIYKDDQIVREGDKGQEIVLKYGKGSQEDIEYIKAQREMDAINLFKIKTYLEKYGYPVEVELEDYATTIPWLVVHRAPAYETREKYFEPIYKAYLTGDISIEELNTYLGGMYELKNNERLKIENPYTGEQELSALIQELGLEKKKSSVDQSVE